MSLENNALILIINDNPKDVELITHNLKKVNKNWSFLVCDNKSDFSEILSNNRPDLIISEYKLPSFPSIEALNLARKVVSNIPFIVVSDLMDEEEAISFIIENKMNDYLSKDNLKRLGQSVIRELNNLQLKNKLEQKEQEQKRSLKLLRAINDITTSLLDVDSLTEIANIITEKLISHFNFEDCVIYQFDDETNLLTQVAAIGPKKLDDSSIKNALQLKLGEGIVGSVAKSLKPEIVHDLTEDSRYIKDLDTNKSEITVPIILDGLLIGIIDSEHKEEGFYTELHLQDLQTVAGVIATKFKAGQDRERLIISELRLSQITGNIEAAVIRYIQYSSGEGEFLYASPKTIDIYEVSSEEVLENDQLIWDQIYHKDRDWVNNIYEQAIKTGLNFSIEFRIVTPSGKQKWIETSGSILKQDDGSVISDTINRDITERIDIAKHIEERELLLRSLTDNIPGVIIRFTLDQEGNDQIEYISEGCKEIYEISQSEILADKSKLWELVFPEDAEEMMLAIKESQEKMSIFDFIYRIKTKSGEVKHLHVTGTPRGKDRENLTIWDTVVLDKTDEILFKESLQETNERLLEAQELTNIGDWAMDIITEEIFLSPTIHKIYEKEGDIPIEEGLNFYKKGFSRNRITAAVKNLIENGTPYTEELELITEKGNHRWVRAQGKATFKNDKCVRIHGTLKDITEDVELRKTLKENEFRLETAVRGANIGIWDANIRDEFTTVNTRWLEMIGYENDEVEDPYTLFFSRLHPDDIDKLTNELNSLKKGAKESFEIVLRVKSKSDEYRTILDKGTALEFDSDGHVTRMIGTHLDITNTITLQKELEDKEQRLSAAVEGADLGVWEFDFETNSNYVNDKYLEILGYEKDEIEFSLEWFQNLIHPDDIYLINQELARITECGENEIDITIRMKAKDGSYKILRDKGRIVEFGKKGSVKRLVGTILDITETVKLQETIQQSLDEKVLLLSEIHHRVKNNLAIVTGLLDLQSMGSDNENLKKILAETARRIKSIATVHELLYNTDSFSDIPFARYVETLTGFINETLDDKKGIINLDINEELAININQAIPLGLLLNELITNSFKYAFDASKKKNQIDFSLTFKDDRYIAKYLDSGSGFDKSQLQKSSSLGSLLIDTLLKQLDSEYEIETEKGFNLTFTFSKVSSGAHSNI